MPKIKVGKKMSEEKLRKILIELWRDAQGTSMYPNEKGNQLIDQAILAIKKLWRIELAHSIRQVILGEK